MKKTLLVLFTTLAMGTTALAQTAADVAGKYIGDLYISLAQPVGEETEAMPRQKVELVAGEAEGTVDFALHNFALGEMLLGDIELKGIGLTYADGKYSFAKNEPVALSFLGGAIEATASLNHETSYVEGGQLFADIDVVWTNADEPTPIYVRFSGKGNDTGLGQAPVAPAAAQAVYTLSGVRVAATSVKQLPKGVYVVGGKKVIVK